LTYVIPHHADVPQLIGKPIDEARATLLDLGFTVKTAAGVYRLNIPADNVAGIDPQSGTSLEKGATVTLVPSLGPRPVTVPKLVGKTVDQAEDILTRAHLDLGAVKQEFSDSPEDTIIRIDTPLTDGKAPRNSAIDVVVSKGPAPVPVPNVVGATAEDAKQTLEDAGFVVDDQKTKFSTEFDRGVVVRQTPADGKKLQPGETVKIVISLGPKNFPCPDFRFLSRTAAQALAEQFGLDVTFLDLAAFPGTTVVNQSTAVGTTVTYGDPITLYLA
jgi:serine/threonine-protein kinase